MTAEKIPVVMTVNGRHIEHAVEPRLLLVDFLRHTLRLTGTHVGCAHGVWCFCGSVVKWHHGNRKTQN